MKNKKLKKRDFNENFDKSINFLNKTDFKKTKFLKTDSNKNSLIGYFLMED